MKKTLFVGLTTVDLISYVTHYPGSNEKLRAEEQLIYAGGPAANAAVACAAMGGRVTLVSGLGDHPLAEIARADLQDHGVKIMDMADDRQKMPVLSSIVVENVSGNRAVVYTNTSDRRLAGLQGVDRLLADVGLVMTDGFYIPQALEICQAARETGIKVVLDGGSWKEGMDKLLQHVDIAICSENFMPPGCGGPESISSFLAACGIRKMAITRGGNSILAGDDSEIKEVPVAVVDAVDTLGAGDIFHGVFCQRIMQHDFITSLHHAAVVATMSCRSRGSRQWLHSLPERLQYQGK